MFALTVAGLAAIVGAGVVSAAPNPTEPSSASVFRVGSTCTIKWDVDATGSWKEMNIQLMTGDNFNMIHITTIAQNLDATDATKNTYEYPCPEVTPNSAIYFYQFSSPSDPKNLLWTTRWTLASADGQTTPPTETTQPDGKSIPWGKGALVDPSSAVPAPAYLSAAGQTGSASGSSAAAGTASTGAAAGTSAAAGTTPAAGTSAAVTSAAAATTPAASSTAAMTTSRSSAARAAASGSSTASASAATSSTNAAVGAAVPGAVTLLGAVLAAVGLF